MRRTTHPDGIESPGIVASPGGEKKRSTEIRHRIVVGVWGIGLTLFVVSCFIFHAHPQPFPLDIAITQTLTQLQDVPWAGAILLIPGIMNETYTSTIALSVLFIGMLLIGEVRRRRRKSAVLWYQSAIFLAVFVPLSTGINLLASYLVNRPRPSSLVAPIKHHTLLIGIPTYPSGHTEHSVVFYGFLLYLSFTRPVREWRYRWLLIPLQLYAVFDILTIGISRIVAEDHWITDILGGYLIGALGLCVCIFLYRRVTEMWVRKKRARRSVQMNDVENRMSI